MAKPKKHVKRRFKQTQKQIVINIDFVVDKDLLLELLGRRTLPPLPRTYDQRIDPSV